MTFPQQPIFISMSIFKVACRNKQCPNLVSSSVPFGWCPSCAKVANRMYDKASDTRQVNRTIYDAKWDSLRAYKLRISPLCELCMKASKAAEAVQVDHIVPIKSGGARLDLANLQSLCLSCHGRKSLIEYNQRKRMK